MRALASPPTGCIIGTEQVREYHQDCGRGELRLVLKDGTEHLLTFNLYSAETLKALFAPHANSRGSPGDRLFLSRFAPDANWTAKLVNGLPGRQEVIRKLQEIEEALAASPGGSTMARTFSSSHSPTAQPPRRVDRERCDDRRIRTSDFGRPT